MKYLVAIFAVAVCPSVYTRRAFQSPALMFEVGLQDKVSKMTVPKGLTVFDTGSAGQPMRGNRELVSWTKC